MQPNYRSLARACGEHVLDHLSDMHDCRTELDRDFYAGLAAQCARAAATHARRALAQSARLNSTKGGHPAPAWNGR